MPISYRFYSNTIWITLSGNYSLEDGNQTYCDILNDPAFRQGMNLLMDARQSTVSPSIAEITRRVMFLKSVAHQHSGRVAIVVSDTLRYGLSRMLSIYAQMDGINVEVFMDIEEAMESLETGVKQ